MMKVIRDRRFMVKYRIDSLGVCRTFQFRKKWLPNLLFKNVKTFLNSLPQFVFVAITARYLKIHRDFEV